MQYSGRKDESEGSELVVLRKALESVVRDLGMELIELHVFRVKARKGAPPGAQIRALVYKPVSACSPEHMGTDDCSRAHRAMLPRLEQAFPEHDLSVEVSTPGISRVIRDGVELAHYRGRGVRLYRTDISAWSLGIVEMVDEHGLTIQGTEGLIRLDYQIIAKARLEHAAEPDRWKRLGDVAKLRGSPPDPT